MSGKTLKTKLFLYRVQLCKTNVVLMDKFINCSSLFSFQKEIYKHHQQIQSFYPLAVKIKNSLVSGYESLLHLQKCLTKEEQNILLDNIGTTDIQNFNQNLLHHIIENCISDYEDISAIENQDENLFTGAFFFTRDMTQNKNDLSLMKHYVNHLNKDDLHKFYALYKFTFEIDEQLSFRFFNLNEQMDNVLRSSALSSDISFTFTDKDVQVYLFNQSQSSIKLIKVTEITKLSNLKDFFIMKTTNNNSSTTTLLFLDIDGVINNYQSHVKMENIFDDCEKFFKREVNHFTKEQNDFLLSEMEKNGIRLCFTKTDFHLKK